MSRFQISEQKILAFAYNDIIYKEGLACYYTGRVLNFTFFPAKSLVKADIIGELFYTVQLGFKKDGNIRNCHCTCPNFISYHGGCKHVIAVLKAAQKELPAVWQEIVANQVVEELLGAFNPPQTKDLFRHEELTLEAALHIVSGYRISAQLQLRLGLQRLYVIKNIEKFILALKTGEMLEFGKKFSFDPARQSFKPEDQAIITMLQEMMDQHTALLETEDPYFSSVFSSQKLLPLSGYYLAKFLDALGDKVFLLSINGAPLQPSQVIRGGLPLSFSLQTQDQGLSLTFEDNEIPLRLTAHGNYYASHQKIYQASPSQEDLLPPVLSALNQGFETGLPISKNLKERFASEVLPQLDKLGKLTIDPDLTKILRQEPLKTLIYFDRAEDQKIVARLEFHYGNTIINPFASAGEPNSEECDRDFILIRDTDRERQVIHVFEQADFFVYKGQIFLEDDDKIWDFTASGLPQLKPLAEIYYSDQFKVKIRSANFSSQIRLNERQNILEVSFQYDDLDPEELAEIFHSLQLKKKYHRLRDSSFLDLSQAEFSSVAQLLDHLNLDTANFDEALLKLPVYRAMYIDSFLRQSNLPDIQRDNAFSNLVQRILEPQSSEFEIPPELRHVLRDYQKTGFKWLKTLASFGLGGILADDMGLGKTIQVLAFILSEKTNSSAPVLVVAPKSLIYNWQEEAQKFTPDQKVLVVEGAPQERLARIATVEEQWDLVITSYPVLRRDIAEFAKLSFSYCFLDEAQHTKNPQTLNAKSVQQINAKSYFALTGTPIENSLSELWSLFNFIMPGYLLTHQEFRKKYELPIIKDQDPQALTELSRHINPFILRRTKKEVLQELPAKIDTVLRVPLTEEQKKIYVAYLQQAKGEIAQELQAVGFNKSHIKILAALTRLRQICCHPSLFLQNYTGESGKMQLLQEVITDALGSGHRILLFSQFTTMLDIIQKYLIAEEISHFYLSGFTKAIDRLKMVNSFNAGIGSVFLISLKAGGLGLNLTEADMVIHYDPWWNPAVEDQATDRAHRIGQLKSIQVVKLITQGTIEEKIIALQDKKKALIDSVIQPGETMISKLSEEELKALFDLT